MGARKNRFLAKEEVDNYMTASKIDLKPNLV